jgi:hypothetical protein
MKIEDIRGKPIEKGFHVRYTGTGSAGEAVDFKTDDEGTWILLDTTDLWYKTDSVEVIGETEYSKMKHHTVFKSEENKEVNEKENVHAKVKKSKGKFEDVDMSNELCDGGG